MTRPTAKTTHHDIAWQQAVYTRKHIRDTYTFSHACTTSVRKCFPSSLSVQCLSNAASLNAENLSLLRSAPVLVLVTGDWAVHLSIEAYQGNADMDRLPKSRYDHLDRLGYLGHLGHMGHMGHPGHMDSAECSELTDDYRALKYHCTVATYEAGSDHAWRLNSVSPVLSDIVILPRLLEETRLKTVMSSFCRATRKALRDSVRLAGNGRAREECSGK